MTVEPELTGRVAGEIVSRLLKAQSVDQDADWMPAIRIKGFNAVEVEEMLRVWRGLVLPSRNAPIKAVVAARREPREYLAWLEPPQERLADHEMLTWHRNRLVPEGTILVEVGPQPDAEGLDTLYTIRDDSVLSDPPAGSPGSQLPFTDRFELLLQLVWASRTSAAAPALVFDRVATVYGSLASAGAAPSLRQWIAFLAGLATHAADHAGPWDGPAVDEAVGATFHRLGLFPDEQIFTDSNPQRRIIRNHHVSTFANPDNKQLRDGELLERIDALQPPEGAIIREGLQDDMRALATGSDPEARQRISYSEWLWLFASKRRVMGLGDKIRAYIDKRHPARLIELDMLEVVRGLNERVRASAEELVAAEPTGSEPALFMLLSRTLQRQVNKILARTEAVSDPLVAILRSCYQQTNDISTFSVEQIGSADETRYSLRLFALLYKRSLEGASMGSSGASLRIDPVMTKLGPLMDGERTRGDTSNDDSSESGGWGPLMFRVVATRADGTAESIDTYSWDPTEHASFGRLVQEPPTSFPIPFVTASGLDSIAVEDGRVLSTGTESTTPPALAAWTKTRSEFFGDAAAEGLAAEPILDYVDKYTSELGRLMIELVPQGAPLAALDFLIDLDTGRSGDDRAALLGTHPVRLRWFAAHLRALRDLISRALSSELRLNEANEELFFERVEELKPFDQPALLSTGFRKRWIAARTSGPHAEFASVAGDVGSVDRWIGGVDLPAIQVLARVVRRYLSEFPHKRDGLALLVLDREGDAQLVDALLKQITVETSEQKPVLRVHVAAPAHSHERISAALARHEAVDDRGRQLLPSFTTTLLEWDGGPVESCSSNIDLALAPDLFGAEPHMQSKTRPVFNGAAGGFRPWIDEAIDRSDPPGHAVSIRRLLPSQPDRLLEYWSSLNVRRANAGLVGEDPLSIDYLELTVSFVEQQSLFRQLHELAHWVVTLDRFIDREHFDALDDPPEIIQVQEGVGSAQAHTLTVSSGTGRAFVTERLRKRLGAAGLGLFPDHAAAQRVADRLYDLGRHVAPSLMLRALGLGRSAEETIGLVVARWKARHWDPVLDNDSYIEVWITLDDFTHWFGGSHEVRSDLLRLRFFPDGSGGGAVDAEVVEAKFRQSNDLGRAVDQVVRTARLVSDALRTGDQANDDSEFWLQEIERAISQTSKQSHSPDDLPTFVRMTGRTDLPSDRDLAAQIRGGKFSLRHVGATVAHTNSLGGAEHTEFLDVTDRETVLETVRVVRTSRDGLQSLLLAIGKVEGPPEEGPDPSETPESPTSGPDGSAVESSIADRRTDMGPASTPVPTDAAQSDPIEAGEASADDGEAPQRESTPTRRGMTEAALNEVYQRMLDTFARYNIVVRRPSIFISEGPGFLVTRFEPGPGVKVAALRGAVDEIKLSLSLGRDQELRHYVDGGAYVFEVPKSDEQRFPVFADEMWSTYSWRDGHLEAPLGRDISDEIVAIDFSSSNTPHLLIAGMTGAGKSVALETLLQGLVLRHAPSELRLNLIDPKGTELTSFHESPYLEGEIGWSADDAAETLLRLAVEMDRRYRDVLGPARQRDIVAFNASVDESKRIPWQVVVLDEYADLTSDKEDRKRIEEPLQRIAQKGRASGIHLVVATQRPSAEVITSEIRSNLGAQLALRVFNSSDSRIVIGEGGAEALAGRGDALYRTPQGTRRIQCGVVRSAR